MASDLFQLPSGRSLTIKFILILSLVLTLTATTANYAPWIELADNMLKLENGVQSLNAFDISTGFGNVSLGLFVIAAALSLANIVGSFVTETWCQLQFGVIACVAFAMIGQTRMLPLFVTSHPRTAIFDLMGARTPFREAVRFVPGWGYYLILSCSVGSLLCAGVIQYLCCRPSNAH